MMKLIHVLAILCLSTHGLLGGAAVTNAAARSTIDYFIVITGGEILEGVYADAHTQFITRTLTPLGLRCVGSLTVDDAEPDMLSALRFATNHASLVITTGGLGPTDNDITRQTLSKFTGIPLEENPELLQSMAKRHNTPPDQLRPNMRRQTQTPVKGSYLKSAFGTSAGLVFDLGATHIVALPGPPRELQAMVKEELAPMLTRHYGLRAKPASITIRFLGLGQSQIDQTIKQTTTLPPGLITASQFEGGRVDFTFSLPDDSGNAKATLEAFRKKIHEALGRSIYADDDTTLEETVVRLLQNKPATLALAEMGSGGALAAALSRTGAAGKVLAGDWVAPNEAVLQRIMDAAGAKWDGSAEPSARLQEIAARVRAAAKSDFALIVGPAPPEGSGSQTLVVGLKWPDGRWETQTFTLRSGADAQAQLVTQLLGFLWQRLR